MSAAAGIGNLGNKVLRRLRATPKPLIRAWRRRVRAAEHEQFARDAADVGAEIARVARGTGPILAGPWLAEVGYEVLYWVPFVRWFQDRYAVPRERLIAVSRGGLEAAYDDLTSTYVDLFDLMTPAQFGARNAERRMSQEGGGQKQSDLSPFDQEVIQGARGLLGAADVTVLHPSLMFRLFRQVWYGNLPQDLMWTHLRHVRAARAGPRPEGLPREYIAAKFYAGPALHMTDATREAVRALVARAATVSPVVVLDTDLPVDEHRDFDLRGIPNLTFLGARLTPRDNLGLQLDAIAHARSFLGTCGGLAWHAPFLGVPTVAVYEDDRLLTPHLFAARQAGERAGAADFAPLDLRALVLTGLLTAATAVPRLE